MSSPDTSVGVLTPPGAGAIGVIRVQGPDALRVVSNLFQPKHGSIDATSDDGRLRFGRVVDGSEIIDDGVACVDRRGGLTRVDLCVHGGTRVIERVLTAAERRGASIAEAPIRAADVWGASNLIEAEALDALVIAKTERAARFLIRQRTQLPNVIRSLASSQNSEAHIGQTLQRMLDLYPLARRLMGGVTIVIVGPVNSGKSTLFNRLAGRTAAVVSDVEGTTRDWVSEDIVLDGVPVTLVDTAGHRSTTDGLEEAAISAGAGVARQADLVLSMLDGSRALPNRSFTPSESYAHMKGALCVVGKSDLPHAWSMEELIAMNPAAAARSLRISAARGAGLEDLLRRLTLAVGCGFELDNQAAFFTPRQVEAVREIRSISKSNPHDARWKLLDKLLGSDKGDGWESGQCS